MGTRLFVARGVKREFGDSKGDCISRGGSMIAGGIFFLCIPFVGFGCASVRNDRRYTSSLLISSSISVVKRLRKTHFPRLTGREVRNFGKFPGRYILL